MRANQFAEFHAVIHRMLEEKGIELPSIPVSAGRNAYLALLADGGYCESEILPVFDTTKATPEMMGAMLAHLLQAIESDDPKLIQPIAWIALNTTGGGDNTNLILHTLKENLFREIELGGEARNSYVGVFPTNSFNAQCRRYKGSPLVLVDTGCVELIEAAVASFLAAKPDSEKVKDLVDASVAYFASRSRADVSQLRLPGVDWGNAHVGILATVVEEFVVAHELGHLSLGHLDAPGRRAYALPNGKTSEVVEKSWLQEYQADAWACKALVKRAVANASSRNDLAAKLLGPVVFIGLGAIMEAAAQSREIQLSVGHPPALQRLQLVFMAFEQLRVSEHSSYGRAFMSLVLDCLRKLNVEHDVKPIQVDWMDQIQAVLH